MVESARERAHELGDPRLAPPFPLEHCNRNTIELALAKPQAAYAGVELYPDLASKAAALLYVLSKSQACGEGNKRVALLLVVEFLRLNGARLQVRPLEVADMILAIAESDQPDHDHVVAGLAEWVAARMRRESP